MYTLVKGGAVSTMSDVINNISYSTKVSELGTTSPIAQVVLYDDLYKRMQFATGYKWGTESVYLPAIPTQASRQLAWLLVKNSSTNFRLFAALLAENIKQQKPTSVQDVKIEVIRKSRALRFSSQSPPAKR